MRRVAVSDGFGRRGVISGCVMSGPECVVYASRHARVSDAAVSCGASQRRVQAGLFDARGA